MLFNICKTAYSSQGCVKEHDFWANFRRKIKTILFINDTFFKLETQNLNVRSTIKGVLRI